MTTLTKFIETSIAQLSDYVEMRGAEHLQLSAMCNRFKRDGYVQVNGCIGFSGGGDIENAIKEAFEYLFERQKRGYFKEDADVFLEIGEHTFDKGTLYASEWEQINNLSCGAFVLDITGQCHNVQQWYEDGSYNLL